jgi:peptidoglycan/xylan/chitin deacetylase (PgdA/CDA1 family)
MPVDRRSVRRRGGRLGRLLLGLLVVIALAVGAATVVSLLRHSPAKHAAPPPAPAPPPAQPVLPPHPTPAAVLLAQAQQRAITRLAGLGVPVFCGGPNVRDVALTFDDGPGPYTGGVVAILRRYHAQATFFLVGNRIRYWPTLPAAEALVGAVGDHTWSHADLTRLPRRAARAEINRALSAIAKASRSRVRLFRTPYGRDPSWLGGYFAARGLLEIRWTVDSNDYLPRATAARIVRRVASALRPGAIVLLHDIHLATVRALPRILALIRTRHLQAVSVPELLRRDPPGYRQLMADNRGRGCVNLATARHE